MVGRREFLGVLGVVVGAGAGGLWRSAEGARPGPHRLRPPGALDEEGFLAACIRCGQCIVACPYETLLHDDDGRLADRGTPFLIPRRTPCSLCKDYDSLKCIDACPTGALEDPGDMESIRMGLAVIDPETCLAFNGVVCRACWHKCPFPNQAIRFDSMLRPVIVEDACIGCGLCDKACLAEPSAIRIVPTADRKGGGP